MIARDAPVDRFVADRVKPASLRSQSNAEVASFHRDIRSIMRQLRTPEDIIEGLAMLALTSVPEVRKVRAEFDRLLDEAEETNGRSA